MKKRLLTAFLAICILASILPMEALAAAPGGYTADDTETMAYRQSSDSTTIDVKGKYNDEWIKTTYNDIGYEVATSGLDGADVSASAAFINNGQYVQLSYTVTAGDSGVTDGKLAVHADVQIGGNDYAAVEVIQDGGKIIGLKMVDDNSSNSSYNAQFNLYFDGTGGVTPVDTYWFGKYSERDDSDSTYGYIYFAPLNDSTKSSSGAYTQENGIYTKLTGIDSGFAVSWQDIALAANESKTFSFILGVGEKADPPAWGGGDSGPISLTLAADVGAEQSSRKINVSAKVTDAAGLTDTLYYSVDGGTGTALGSVVADGTLKAITGQLDLSSYTAGTYTFSFWVVNSKGAASASVSRTITINGDGTISGLDDSEEQPPVPDHYTVTVQTDENGTASASADSAAEGTEITLTAVPNSGCRFKEWQVVSGGVTIADNTFTMPAGDVTVKAVFEKIPDPEPTKYTVTAAAEPAQGGTAAGGGTYDAGASVTVTAAPAEGYRFVRWTENGVEVSAAASYTFTLTKDTVLTAEFSYVGGGNGGSNVTTYPVTVGDTTHGTAKADRTHAAGGTTVTITVTPDEGYELDELTVTDKNGREISVKDKGDGKYSFTMPAGKVTVSVTFAETDCPRDETCPIRPLTDAGTTAWYHDGVHYCIENGLMSGYGSGLFGPNDALTRAELAQILYNKEGQPGVTGGSVFTDVADGAWYTSAVTWAAANGIVTGYGNGLFGPNDPITREQLAAMLWRYAEFKDCDTTQGGMSIREFNDYGSVSGYAMDAMTWAVNAGVIGGYEDQTLRPQAGATRAQAAQMLKNFLENT